jgi:hypothetical protein
VAVATHTSGAGSLYHAAGSNWVGITVGVTVGVLGGLGVLMS